MFMGALAAAILYILVSTLSETDVETHRWRILGVALGAAVRRSTGTLGACIISRS